MEAPTSNFPSLTLQNSYIVTIVSLKIISTRVKIEWIEVQRLKIMRWIAQTRTSN